MIQIPINPISILNRANKSIPKTNNNQNSKKNLDSENSLINRNEESKSTENELNDKIWAEAKSTQDSSFELESIQNNIADGTNKVERTISKYNETISLFKTTFKQYDINIFRENLENDLRQHLVIFENHYTNLETGENQWFRLAEIVCDKSYFNLLHTEIQKHNQLYRATSFEYKLINACSIEQNIEVENEFKEVRNILNKYRTSKMLESEFKDDSHLFKFLTDAELDLLFHTLSESSNSINLWADLCRYAKNKTEKWILK